MLLKTSLFSLGEALGVPEEIYEAHGDAAVDVQDEVGLLARRDLLDLEGVAQQRGRGEVGHHELLDEGDPLVGVVDLKEINKITCDLFELSISICSFLRI